MTLLSAKSQYTDIWFYDKVTVKNTVKRINSMNELKEIFESLSARIKSPFFGYFFFFSIFMNWKAWFSLFFEDKSVTERIEIFELGTNSLTLIWYPLILAFFAALSAPWLRLFFVWAVEKPVTLRNLVQVRSENKILTERNRLKKLESESQALEEEKILAEARRDAELKDIEDEDARSRAEEKLRESRKQNSDNANLRARMAATSKNNYRFYVKNVGKGIGYNVEFRLKSEHGQPNPLSGDYKEVFPVKELHPEDEVSILANLSIGMGSKFEAILTWLNEDGTEGVRNATLTT